MKKTLLLIAGIIGLFICSSSFNTSGIGIAPGKTAPTLTVANEKGATSLATMRGNYVVLNFWSAADPAGRINTKRNQDSITNLKNNGLNISQLSINTDSSEKLFSTIVSNDNLNPALQYHVNGKAVQSIKETFMVDKGVNTIIIDPDGKIIAVNPKAESLTKIIIGDIEKR